MPLPPGRGKCSVEGCDRDIFTSRGWCEMHYQRWRKHGDPAYERPRDEPATCATPDCAGAVRSKGLCSTCYHRILYRQRRAAEGKPEPASPIPNCGICGEPFQRVRRQRYCSDACSRLARQSYYIQRDYGLSRDEYLAMAKHHAGKCAICGRADEVKGVLSVDHCHETGKVRGLLCHHCNAGLGHFKDDPALLAQAMKYLGA